MILTITTNPAVDINYKLEELELDTVNRVANVLKSAGGKGINVTRVLRQLGEKTAATGFLGGTLGAFIREELNHIGVEDYFVPIQGETRNCIAILHEGQQTEILESGPEISAEEESRFVKDFSKTIEMVHLVTISGSLPKGLSNSFYTQLIQIANEHKKPVLLDVKGQLLATTLNAGVKPYLIKPNEEEIQDLLNVNIEKEDGLLEAIQSADLLQDVPWVVVTMGSKGALIRNEGSFYKVTIPTVEAKNPVGSGDSVIAGFAAGISRALSGERLIKFGLSMGVLNAMEEKTGKVNPDNLDWCMENITVVKVR